MVNDLLTPVDDEQDVRRMSRQEIMRTYDIRDMQLREWLQEWKKERRGKPRHHRTTLGPTHRGKTTNELKLNKIESDPDNQVIILSAKPPHRDPVMNAAAEQLNLVITEEWPPERAMRKYHKMRGKNGYVLRPHRTMKDLDWDNENVHKQFNAAILDAYGTRKSEPKMVVFDEAHRVVNVYGLSKPYKEILMSGLPDCAGASLIQRGRNMPYEAYNAPEDLIIYNDPDVTNRERYAEIGGVDPYVVLIITQALPTYETKDGHTISDFVHIRRAGPRLTIVRVT